MNNNNGKRLKADAQTERETIRKLFSKRAAEAPIPSPFDPVSLREWDEYVQEMRELESQMREAGEQL